MADLVNSTSDRRVPRMMWLVQIIEYVLGFAVAATTISAQQPLGPALVAVLIVGNATTVKAPLSAFRKTSPRVHQFIGCSIAVLSIVIALVVPMELSSQLVVIAVAVAQGFLSVRFGHGF